MKAKIVKRGAPGAARAGAERGAVRDGLGEREAPVQLAAKDDKTPAPAAEAAHDKAPEGAEPAPGKAPELPLPVKAGGQPSEAEKKAHKQLRPEKPKP